MVMYLFTLFDHFILLLFVDFLLQLYFISSTYNSSTSHERVVGNELHSLDDDQIIMPRFLALVFIRVFFIHGTTCMSSF